MIFLVILGWILSGFVAWCGGLADLYAIGKKYPRLGTPDQLWEEDRWGCYGVCGFAAMLGPLGLITLFFATGLFHNGFRLR